MTRGYLAPNFSPSYTHLGSSRVTTDEELNLLESQLRRLKIEYEMFFSNPTKRPPTDVEWKVLSLLRKFSDGVRMNMTQRFRYNEMAQRYAVYSDLWRKKTRIREEGYRRPQDALLSVQGVREAVHTPQHPQVLSTAAESQPFLLQSVDDSELEQVERLYNTLVAAKTKAGEKVSGDLGSFSTFVSKKTQQLRKQHNCETVEYSVELADGQVKLKAKAKA